MKRFIILQLMAVLSIFSQVASSSVPQLINFQGVLKDGSGNPVVNGGYSVTFRIYDVPTGGTALWAETQSVTTTSGLFAVLLGTTNTIPDSVFKGSQRWLGIQVSPDPELTPRQQLVSVGYAYRVNSVDSASGGTITSKVSIGPGHTNTGQNAFVTGGYNTASGDYSTIGGGEGDTASGYWSTVNGGSHNIAMAFYATVGGGTGNTASGIASTTDGGFNNIASGVNASVGGGFVNTASGSVATVGGGQVNIASAFDATISGGDHNTASGELATVSGGLNNVSSGIGATVGGGSINFARGQYSVVSGGGGVDSPDSNSSSGGWSVIPGGRANAAAGNYSFAAGRRAKANHAGVFVWADSTDSDFASTATNQFLIRAKGGVGIETNSPNSRLQVNGAIATSVASVSSNTTLDESYSIVLGANPVEFSIFLPTAVGIAGRQYVIKNVGSNAIFIVPAGGQTIDGNLSGYTLGVPRKYLNIVSDGANWQIIGNN